MAQQSDIMLPIIETKIKLVQIPEGTKFIQATVYEVVATFDKLTGIETFGLKTYKALINMQVISCLCLTTLETGTRQWFSDSGAKGIQRTAVNGNWYINGQTEKMQVTEVKEVYRITKLSDEINLNAKYITID